MTPVEEQGLVEDTPELRALRHVDTLLTRIFASRGKKRYDALEELRFFIFKLVGDTHNCRGYLLNRCVDLEMEIKKFKES